MTTNQTIDRPESHWLKTIAECNSAADQLNGLGGPKAKRTALRMKTLGLVIHDRACFLAKQTLKFKIENCEAVMRGQWEKVKFNRIGAVGPKVEPVKVRVDFTNPLTKNIPGNPGYQRPMYCARCSSYGKPRPKELDFQLFVCQTCVFKMKLRGNDEMKNINVLKSYEFNNTVGGIVTSACHYAHVQYNIFGLEKLDKECIEWPGEFTTRTTLSFQLDDEKFDIGACELRDLLRQREATTSDHREMKVPEYSGDLGSMVDRLNRWNFADGRITTSDPSPQLRQAIDSELSQAHIANADNVSSGDGPVRWTTLYEYQSEQVYQLSSAYVNPPQWTDQDKESYDAHVGKDGWITRILYKNY